MLHAVESRTAPNQRSESIHTEADPSYLDRAPVTLRDPRGGAAGHGTRTCEDAGKPGDEGISFTLCLNLGEHPTSIARHGYSDAEVTDVRQLLEARIAHKGLVGAKNNMKVFAVEWAESPDDGGETILECFRRRRARC